MRRVWFAAALAAFSLSALPAAAQSIGSGYYAGNCRTIGGRYTCTGASGAYQRWDNGAAAGPSGSSTDSSRHYYPHSWGGYSTFYGYGH